MRVDVKGVVVRTAFKRAFVCLFFCGAGCLSPQTVAWTFKNIGLRRQREVVVGVVVVAAAVVS